ncbi:MAG: DUF4960 domain-containing protein [Bacteroidaceae bacterium]|nr:DUF4960 domain-containing protein [Bacteroidaceae bacterium]
MKTLLKSIYSTLAIMAMLLVAASFNACSKTDDVDLRLQTEGTTATATVYINSLAIDTYKAVIDHVNHTITVNVPQGYNVDKMKITELNLPEGATTSIKAGETVNMRTPITVTIVYNGHHQDYTLQVVPDYVEVLEFTLNGTYRGFINNEEGTIAVTILKSEDITALAVTMKVNEGAVINPQPTGTMDFSQPREFVVTKNTASKTYVVTVTQAEKGDIAFVGSGLNVDGIASPEEKAAAQWMLKNVAMSEYISFSAVVTGDVDLSQYKVIWWHHHVDGGDNPPSPEDANNAVRDFMNYYKSGGNLLLTRYALAYLASPEGDPDHANIIGIGISKDGRWPNNSWGGNEYAPDIVDGPWTFNMVEGQEKHPIFQGLIQGENPQAVYCFDKGYATTNSTAQWHIGSDWGGYSNHDVWREKTGAIDLARGGDGAVVIAEWPSTDGSGKVIGIGSGCYDWYAHEIDASGDKYHKNIEIMTLNAINYLKGE